MYRNDLYYCMYVYYVCTCMYVYYCIYYNNYIHVIYYNSDSDDGDDDDFGTVELHYI